MGIKWQVKAFEDLTVQELYGLLRLREQVFIIEQDCIYPDLDNKDQKALHILGVSDDEVVSYARIFRPGDYFETASIGRVVTHKAYRNKKVGYTLMQKSIAAVEQYFGQTIITISAQRHLTGFYESLGFIQVGEGYLEDNIPHIRMVKQ